MRIIIQDIRHLQLKQDLLWVGTATLATVIIWIAFAIYTAFNQNTTDLEVKKLLTPLNPSLDQQALSYLSDRYVPPLEFNPIIIEKEGSIKKITSVNRTTATSSASPLLP
jgi:hypothetical protein